MPTSASDQRSLCTNGPVITLTLDNGMASRAGCRASWHENNKPANNMKRFVNTQLLKKWRKAAWQLPASRALLLATTAGQPL